MKQLQKPIRQIWHRIFLFRGPIMTFNNYWLVQDKIKPIETQDIHSETIGSLCEPESRSYADGLLCYFTCVLIWATYEHIFSEHYWHDINCAVCSGLCQNSSLTLPISISDLKSVSRRLKWDPGRAVLGYPRAARQRKVGWLITPWMSVEWSGKARLVCKMPEHFKTTRFTCSS